MASITRKPDKFYLNLGNQVTSLKTPKKYICNRNENGRP